MDAQAVLLQAIHDYQQTVKALVARISELERELAARGPATDND